MKTLRKLATGAFIAAGLAAGNKMRAKVTYPRVPSFYDPPEPLPVGNPGDLVRVELIPLPIRDRIWRVLYRSTDLDGNPSVVSGLIAAPPEPRPAGGWPVVAVCHGTVGLPRGAAPSLTVQPDADDPGYFYTNNLKPFLDAGYAVAFSDYQGLGTPGQSSYLIGAVEGHNVLDSVRAIRSFPEIETSDRLFVWGHSQGGHAASFAVERAPDYAPQLSIAGAVLNAPAAELVAIVEGILDKNAHAYISILPMISVASWSDAYRDAKRGDVLTKAGSVLLDPSCWLLQMKYGALLCRPFRPSQLFKTENFDLWRTFFVENTPGQARLNVPLFVAQGGEDPIVPRPTTDLFVERLRANGETVDYRMYPELDHGTVLDAAMPGAIAWMEQLSSH